MASMFLTHAALTRVIYKRDNPYADPIDPFFIQRQLKKEKKKRKRNEKQEMIFKAHVKIQPNNLPEPVKTIELGLGRPI